MISPRAPESMTFLTAWLYGEYRRTGYNQYRGLLNTNKVQLTMPNAKDGPLVSGLDLLDHLYAFFDSSSHGFFA